MRETFVFQHKKYVLNVTREDFNNLVQIRQVGGHHVWTVSVEAPLNTSRWDLGDAAISAYHNQLDQVCIS